MKIRDKKQFFSIQENFTDRQEAREIFWEQYRAMRSSLQTGQDVQVLCYYGIGGIGKSALLRKLMEELCEKVPKSAFLYFDLGVVQDSKEVLGALRNKLSREARFSFELFDLAMYAYATKTGQNIPAPEIKTLANKSPILSALLEVSQILPGVGIFAKIVEMADKGIAFAGNLLRRYRREIVELDQMSQELLQRKLSYYFALNMVENLQSQEEPFVIFLDTYEKMVNEISAIGEALSHDLWLRAEDGLIQNIPNVLWVIAGREKLKWEQFDPAWKTSLEQHKLECLSYPDAYAYLESYGIKEKNLISKIYDLTHGTPVYLKLCVERFLLLSEYTTPSAEDFGGNTNMLIELYVRYMDDSKKDLIYFLSCLGSWEEELISKIATEVLPNFSITSYERIKGFSFVSESSKGLYTMHQTVVEVLFDSCPIPMKERTIEHALSYYMDRLKASGLYGEMLSYNLTMAVRFSLFRYPNNDEYFCFFQKELDYLFRQMIEACRFSLVNHAFSPIYQRAVQDETSPLCAVCYRVMASLLTFEGKYKESLYFAQKSVELFKKHLGNAHEETLDAKFQLTVSLLKQGQYLEGHLCIKAALRESKRKYGENHPLTIKIESLYAETHILLGKHKEAYRFYQKILQKHMELFGANSQSTVRIMSSISNTLSYLGRYEKALMMREKTVTKCKELLGENHPYTVQEIEFMARELGLLGRYQEDVAIREEVLKKQIELLGEEHPDTLATMNSLGNSLHALGYYERALAIKEKVLLNRKETMGENHPGTLRAMVNLADIFCTLGRKEEAFFMRKEVLTKRSELFGEAHPDTIRAKEYFANSLDDRKCHEEALKLHQEVLEKYKTLFGEDHPETIRALHGMVKSLFEAKKVEEAFAFIPKLLHQLKYKISNRYKKILWLDTVAHILMESGKPEEAKAISIRNIKEAEQNYFEIDEYMKNRYLTMALIYSKEGKQRKKQKYLQKAQECSKGENF